MLVTCPRCMRSLSSVDREGPPSFCMFCGQKLRDSATTPEPGGMLTASHVPFSDNPEEDNSEPPPAEVGGFKLLRFLGAGGMGTVYEAEAIESGQRVAVKLLSKRLASSPSSVERFRQEEVHRAGAEEQQQHRLTDDLPCLLHDVALPRGRQLVRPVDAQSPGGFLCADARE